MNNQLLSGKYKFFGKFLLSISYLRFAKENFKKIKLNDNEFCLYDIIII